MISYILKLSKLCLSLIGKLSQCAMTVPSVQRLWFWFLPSCFLIDIYLNTYLFLCTFITKKMCLYHPSDIYKTDIKFLTLGTDDCICILNKITHILLLKSILKDLFIYIMKRRIKIEYDYKCLLLHNKYLSLLCPS